MIDHLLDSYEDVELEVYHMQTEKLLRGITLDYSFIRIDPFRGIKRTNNVLMLDDSESESGLYSFILGSDLFSIINDGVRDRINFKNILLFLDESYEFQVQSGNYHSKKITSKIDGLKDQSFFEDDELILALIKNKNIKIRIKLREKGRTREAFEEKAKLEDSEAYVQKLLNEFKQNVSNFQSPQNKMENSLQVLGVPYSEGSSRDDLYKIIEDLNLNKIRILKSTLYYHIIFKLISKYRNNNKEVSEILELAEDRYRDELKDLKSLEYKLKAPFITLRNKND